MARKAVSDYGLTLVKCELSKLHVFNSLLEFCNGLIVSLELHEDNTTHYHVYLELKDKIKLIELRSLIELNIFGIVSSSKQEDGGSGSGSGTTEREDKFGINLTTLRDKNHWISYITKEDTDPLYVNVSTSKFHFNWKLTNYVRNNQRFDPLAVFVKTYIQYTRIIREAHSHFWSSKNLKCFHESQLLYVPDVTVKWIQEAVEAFELGKHLFVYGDTGVGKSVLAKWLSRKFDVTEVLYLPCGDTIYELSLLTDVIKIVIAEDVALDYLNKHRQQLLIALDRGILSINVKCQPIASVRVQAQFVILSNYLPYIDSALERRFTIVQADKNGFQKTDVQETTNENEEVQEEDYFSFLKES